MIALTTWGQEYRILQPWKVLSAKLAKQICSSIAFSVRMTDLYHPIPLKHQQQRPSEIPILINVNLFCSKDFNNISIVHLKNDSPITQIPGKLKTIESSSQLIIEEQEPQKMVKPPHQKPFSSLTKPPALAQAPLAFEAPSVLILTQFGGGQCHPISFSSFLLRLYLV